MKQFIAPEIRFEPFGVRDVITASVTPTDPTTTTFTPELPPDELD